MGFFPGIENDIIEDVCLSIKTLVYDLVSLGGCLYAFDNSDGADVCYEETLLTYENYNYYELLFSKKMYELNSVLRALGYSEREDSTFYNRYFADDE